jgi:cytochrome c biogenesis protein CcmG/thiol:disulfide interchange protein DsbE
MSEPNAPEVERAAAPTSTEPAAPAGTRIVRRRRSARSVYAVALGVLALLIGAAWLGRAGFRPVVPGAVAPEFAVTTLAGERIGLEQYRGKVILLNVWATWCAPCREEMPSMERLYRELAGKNFEILAVSVDDRLRGGVPEDALRAFAQEFDLTFPILHSPPDDPANIQRAYQTTGVPESFLIGPDGVIYRRISGATTWDSSQYREQILRLLGE